MNKSQDPLEQWKENERLEQAVKDQLRFRQINHIERNWDR